jgi:cytochrome c
MATRLLQGFIASIFALLPCAAIAGEPDDIEKGRHLAERLCANCHLNKGQGEKQGPTGIPGFRAVANRPGQSADDVVRWLRSAPPMMPDHKLTQNETDALAAFIMSLRRRR